MSPARSFCFAALLIAVGFLSACATVHTPEEPASSNPAVIALLETAHSSAGEGRIPAAAAALERALRIEPKNPVLWQELAQLHLRQGNYQQAESLAARSNSWAGGNRPLRAANWRIISEARSKRGDDAGALEALERAAELE